MIDTGAVDELVRTVVNVVNIVNQADSGSPVPDLVGPVQISVVAGVSSEAGRDLKEATVGNGLPNVVSKTSEEKS